MSDPRRLALETEDALVQAFRQLHDLVDRNQKLGTEAFMRACGQLAVDERRCWGDHRKPTAFDLYESTQARGDA